LTLDQLADALLEIRRYVRTDPEHVQEKLGVMLDPFNGCRRLSCGRLRRNIRFGLRFILSDPTILRGYLYGAAFEIRCEASRMEKEE
jgi:hypothetical protein